MPVTDALRVESVSFAYGKRPVLEGVGFTLGSGERVALLGPNGAGKSTLMRLVTGLLRPSRGTIAVGDWDTRVTGPAQLARRVGSMFQHADQQLFARTVREDVAFGPRATGVPGAEVAARVERALSALGLESVADQHPYDLPPPLRKLAALAGALAQEPVLLVLDEPTAGLDRRAKRLVGDALAQRADHGVALLVITHDLGFAAEVLTRALALERGRMVLDAPLARVLVDERGLRGVGLAPPPLARVSVALDLPGTPIRQQEVAAGLAKRCRA